ncbi:MAG: alpha-galactosidase [Eubacteriales bacterium]|nr:alpha-galactosidase [Eubacteriales bacterium]
METISLQTKNTTYQMGVTPNGFLLHLYYGKKVDCNMEYLLTAYDRGFAMNPYEAGNDRTFSLDVLPQEYPCYGTGDFRTAAVNVKNSQGVYGCDLRFRSLSRSEEKYQIPGLPAVYAEKGRAETIEITLEDRAVGVEVVLKYGILADLDVITRSAVIKNTGNEEIVLDKVYSASLDFLQGDYDVLHFYGRHGMERNMERHSVVHGIQSYGSKRGMSSHQHNPFFILADSETNEDHGTCYGVSLLYSGNFNCEIEKDQFNQIRMAIGINNEMFAYPLKPGEEFYTPEAALVYSRDGLTALSQTYHRLIRYHVCRGAYKEVRRPILINNWEATYLDFTGEKIVDIAKQAADLGVEMLVLDDGWFGERNDDFRGLGDWTVNEKKLGGSLAALSDKIHSLGMKFGLWIEPEMVNENSRLYEKHPDWAFVIPGRLPVRGRNQLVLDFSRKEVVGGIFDQITKVIDSAQIEYIKMDMNRGICDVYSAVEGQQNFGKIMHEYVLGVYEFLDRLLKRYPKLLIEGCAGGGGRFDAGMLYYTPQIWCSDNTDAIERIRIQHGTSFGYPISAVGSHVSAVPNHQTGRITDIHTRSVVAMAGSFGYELDLNKISEDEKKEVKKQIRDYKKYWNLIHNGKYYRLHTPGKDTEMAAWNFTSEDQREVLLNVVSLDTHCNSPVTYIKCKGLKADGKYCREGSTRVYSGNALMEIGVPIPVVMGEYKAWQMHFTEC